jgi:hypothetical protein
MGYGCYPMGEQRRFIFTGAFVKSDQDLQCSLLDLQVYFWPRSNQCRSRSDGMDVSVGGWYGFTLVVHAIKPVTVLNFVHYIFTKTSLQSLEAEPKIIRQTILTSLASDWLKLSSISIQIFGPFSSSLISTLLHSDLYLVL